MSWLKDRWEEVTAQVKMGDNRTASTVRAARAKAAPATTRVNTNQPGWSVRKPQQSLTTQQRIDQSYGGGFSGIKNRVIDTFDANTEADRIKRFARTGLNENYEQQDAGLRKQRIESELKASEAKRDAGGYSNYAPTKAANTVMSGAIRSIHGIGQGMGGLVDLVTPGKGTNRLTDFTKDYGEVWDKKREHAGVNKTAYQLAQLPMTLYGYSVGDKAITGTAQLAAKGISAIPKVGAIVPKVAGAVDTISKSKPMVSAATKLDDIALNGTRAQRVGAKLAQSYAKPGTMGNITALNTLQNAGERSSRGQDNNWGTFATDIATGLAMQGGLNLAGQAGAGVVRGVSNRIIEPTTNLVQRGKSELATGLNTINRGANQHTPYTQLVPTESGRQIVSPRDSGRVIRENFDEISEKTRARIQAAREKVPERFKLNKYGGSNADFDSPTIRNDLTGETIPNPAYRGKNVDPLESLKQEARTTEPIFERDINTGKMKMQSSKQASKEKYSIANSDISRTKNPGMNQDGFTVEDWGGKKRFVSLDDASPETKMKVRKAEAEFERAKANSTGVVAPGTKGPVQIAREKLNDAYSDAIDDLKLQDYATTENGGRTFNSKYNDWLETKYKDRNIDSATIKDMATNPQKYRSQFEAETATQSQPPKSTPKAEAPDPLESLKQEAMAGGVKYAGKTGTLSNSSGKEIAVKIGASGELTLTKDVVDNGELIARAGDTEINGVPLTIGNQGDYFIKEGKLKLDTPTQSQPPKSTPVQKVDPLEPLKQEARKYKSADEFADSLNAMKYGKVTGVGQLPVSKINKTQIKALTERGLPHTDTNLKVSDFKPGRQVTQPLEVYSKGGSWVVENGNHRLAQALANGDETVPVVFKGGEGKKYSTPITDLYNQAHSQPTAKPEAPQATAAKPDAETKFPGLVDDLMQANSTADVMAIYQKYGIPVDQGTADVTYRYKDNKNQLDAVTADMQTADEIRKASVVGTYTVKEQGDYLLSRDLPKRYIDGKNIPKYSGTESEFTVEIPKRGGDLVLVKNDKGTIFSETLDSAQSKYGTTDPELLANRMINGRKAEIVKKADPLEAPKTEAPQPTPDPTAALKQEALKYKSAEEFIDTDKTISVPIRDFPKTDTTSWNEALNNVSKGELSKTAGPVEVVLTPNGYKLVEGNHRAVQALQSGKDSIEAKIISKEGLEKIAQRDGPHIKMNMQDSLTRQQLTDLYNQATQPPKSTPVQKVEPEIPSYVPKDKVDAYLKSDDYLKDQRFKKMADETKSGDPFDHPDMYENPTPEIRKNLKAPQPTKGAIPERAQKVAEHAKQKAREVYEQTGDVTKAKEVHNKVIDKALIPVTENAPTYKATPKPPTPFEKDLQTAGLAPKKAKGLVVSETKPLNGQKIQKVRTAPGKVEQRVVQDKSDEIADALGMPAKDRVPTTDSQRAERVDTAAQNGLENIKNNPEIVRQAAAPSTLKDKTKRKTFEEATKKYLGGTRSAEIERQATIASLNKEFKLSDKEKINAIISRDDPSVPALNEKVMRYNDRFKQLTDAAYKTYTDQGVKMGYVSSYLPRIYKNPETGQEVDLPEFKALIQGSKRMKGREAEKVAVDWLVEKDPTKLLERYYKSMDNAVAGRQYMKDLEDNGLVTASTEPVRGMRPVIAEGLQTDGKVFYAQKDVAHKLNELFGSKEATNLVEKTLEKGAGVNSLFQSFVLSGGVPNTPINAFGMMQLLKEGMALHPIKAGRAFFGGGLSKSYANKVFTAKKDIMKLMVENDLDIRVNLEQTGKWGNKRIRDAFKNEGKAAGLNQAWNEFTNDATFGRFMPMLEVLHFENVYKHQLKGSLIRKPKSPAEAARIAADSTKNFYGKTSVYKTSTRSKAVDDAAGALLFAPRFRESMVNFWVKNAKTFVPTNTLKPEYRDNLKFMAASAAMYAAMTMLNEAMNGARMDENPDGKKDKLIMPASVAGKFGIDTKGKDIAVPFLPSIATVPRNLASLGANLATGKFNEAGKNAKAFASMPVKTVGDILTNEDYFGNKIVQDDSSPLQKFTQAASYVASSNMQPWIREALNVKGQKWDKETKKTWGIKEKSTFETLSNAGELPLRFYKPDTYRYGENWTPRGGKDEKFNFKQQRERAALGGEIKNISKTLKLNKRQDELFKSLSSVEFNDDGTLKEDNNPFYKSQRYTALQDDGVFEAMKQKSKLNAKLNGKPIDPIFSDDLAPDQRRVLLWKKTLPPGTSDPTVKKLYEQDWYQDYRNKESAYFDSKKAWNKKMGYKDATPNTNEYPVASKEVEDAQNAYFALPKGTGDRSSFIRNNPEIWNKMIAFWDSKDAWTNGERSKLGLGAVDDEDSGGFSYGGRRGGRGSKGGSKYDYTKNLFASSSDSASTSKQLRAILEKAMSGKS